MTRVYFDGQTEMGSVIKDAMVTVSEDWTMTELVKAIKEQGYSMFKLETMRVFARI